MSVSSADLSNLIQCNIKILTVASDMIKELPADKYNHVAKPYFQSCLGKHMRHILDHYLCFVRDLDSGVIDYDQRKRDSQLETDRDHVLIVITEIIEALNGLSNREDVSVKVLLCSDTDVPQGEATQSTVRRELQFLQGHTVHHHALIGAMLKFYGMDTAREFGVAASTLVHEETVKVSA